MPGSIRFIANRLTRKPPALCPLPTLFVQVIKDAKCSEKADVYAFGILLWELATREQVGGRSGSRCATRHRVPLPGEEPYFCFGDACYVGTRFYVAVGDASILGHCRRALTISAEKKWFAPRDDRLSQGSTQAIRRRVLSDPPLFKYASAAPRLVVNV